MAFSIPSLPDLITRTTNDLISRLSLGSVVARRAFARILAKVWSGAVDGLHYHIQWASKQFFVAQCDDDMLPAHGVEFGMSPLAASFAAGPVDFAGTPGALIDAGTTAQSNDGTQVTLLAATVIGGGGTVTATARAVVAGAAGNMPAGTALTLIWGVPGVLSAATVGTGGITDGFDAEDPDAFRARMLKRKQNTPQGGAETDYQQWALDSGVGVTRVWVRPQWLGPGTVGVLFVMDDQVGTIIPDGTAVANVAAYINDPSRRPVTADLHVVSPAELSIDLSVHLVPDTADTRAAASAELADLLYREGEPGVVPVLAEMAKTASNAAGVSYATITSPVVEFTPLANQVPVIGVITWV